MVESERFVQDCSRGKSSGRKFSSIKLYKYLFPCSFCFAITLHCNTWQSNCFVIHGATVICFMFQTRTKIIYSENLARVKTPRWRNLTYAFILLSFFFYYPNVGAGRVT